MDTLKREATRRQQVAFALLALVTLGWMAGLGLGFAVAASNDAGFVADTPAWLTPALQGVLAIAIVAVVVTLLAIVRRIRIRAHVMSEALPRLLQS
jgi:hypothetical protein